MKAKPPFPGVSPSQWGHCWLLLGFLELRSEQGCRRLMFSSATWCNERISFLRKLRNTLRQNNHRELTWQVKNFSLSPFCLSVKNTTGRFLPRETHRVEDTGNFINGMRQRCKRLRGFVPHIALIKEPQTPVGRRVWRTLALHLRWHRKEYQFSVIYKHWRWLWQAESYLVPVRSNQIRCTLLLTLLRQEWQHLQVVGVRWTSGPYLQPCWHLVLSLDPSSLNL